MGGGAEGRRINTAIFSAGEELGRRVGMAEGLGLRVCGGVKMAGVS